MNISDEELPEETHYFQKINSYTIASNERTSSEFLKCWNACNTVAISRKNKGDVDQSFADDLKISYACNQAALQQPAAWPAPIYITGLCMQIKGAAKGTEP